MDISALTGPAFESLGVGGTTGDVDTLGKADSSSLYGLGKDDFLKLFLAQLQNQDPTNPVSDKDFLGQLAQMTMIDTLEQVAQSLSGSQLAQSSNLIGKHITGVDVDGKAVDGTVDSVVQSNDAGLVLMVGKQAVKPDNVLTVDTASGSGGTSKS